LTEIVEMAPEEVRAFREEFGLTKAELVERLGSALRTVEDWEAGRRQSPSMLRVALAAVARELSPWRATPKLGPSSTMEDVDHVVRKMFARLGDNHVVDVDDRFERCLGADATPAEKLLLAHCMEMSDGYNHVDPIDDWSSRPSTGWHTSMAFRPEMNGARPSLGFESRHNKVAKQLAVFIDTHRPGERLPEKLRTETALVARGVRVISLSANDVLVDGDSSRETIETVLSEMTDEVLCEDGQISHAWKRPDRR
jgi:transcriptional regulator with XRE-family HTH domain